MRTRKALKPNGGDVEMDPRKIPLGTKVWVYLRHSPGDNQTIESQESAIRKLVKEKNWIIDRVFRAVGLYGKSVDTRRDLERMVYLAKQKPRPADLLVIWDLSRFSRDQIQAQLCRAQLRSDGWQILSMNDEIPYGPLGHIFESLTNWKNEQYLIDLRANTIRSLRYVAERGCIPVGAVCHGYTAHSIQIGTYRDGRLRYGRKPEIDPKIAPLVIQAFKMKAQGAPHSAIAEKTGLYPPLAGSWEHLFGNRACIGEFEFQEEIFTNIYPAILKKELFEAVQKRLAPRRLIKIKASHHPRRKGSTFFMADRAVCLHCGGRMEGKSTGSCRYYIRDIPGVTAVDALRISTLMMGFPLREARHMQGGSGVFRPISHQVGDGIRAASFATSAVDRRCAEKKGGDNTSGGPGHGRVSSPRLPREAMTIGGFPMRLQGGERPCSVLIFTQGLLHCGVWTPTF